MNFGREVARQTSCYTYVIEDEEPALASLNVFEVRLSSDKCILCTEKKKMHFTQHKIKTKKSESAGLQKGDFKMLSLFKFFFFFPVRGPFMRCHIINPSAVQPERK